VLLAHADLDERDTDDATQLEGSNGVPSALCPNLGLERIEAHGKQVPAPEQGLIDHTAWYAEFLPRKALVAAVAGRAHVEFAFFSLEHKEAALTIGNEQGRVDGGYQDIFQSHGRLQSAGHIQNGTKPSKITCGAGGRQFCDFLDQKSRLRFGTHNEVIGVFNAELDTVAHRQFVALDFLVVDEDAMAAAAVLKKVLAILDKDLRVFAGDTAVLQGDFTPRKPTHPEGAAVDVEDGLAPGGVHKS
jgi:hypothetical protein